MQLALAVNQWEIELDTSGSCWLRTAVRNLHITREPGAPLRPLWEHRDEDGGVLRALGCRIVYDGVARAAAHSQG